MKLAMPTLFDVLPVEYVLLTGMPKCGLSW